jgi:hypothetical protein
MIDFLTENLRYDRSFYRADNERKVKNQIKNIFDELVELGIIEIREV